jgi:hypothetical protein
LPLRYRAVGLLILIGVLFVMTLKPAWALTITPDPPITGQPFNVSGYGPGLVLVFTDSGCGGSVVFRSGPLRGGAYNVTVPGLPAGQYHVTVPENLGCVNFSVVPTGTTTTLLP